MPKVRALWMLALLLSAPLLALVPTSSAASAEVVAALGVSPFNGRDGGLVGSSAVHYNGATYVMGGRTSDGAYSSTIYKFNHATRAVEEVANLPDGRQSGAALLLGDTIYYFGGAILVQRDVNQDGSDETIPQATNEIISFKPATKTVERLSVTLPVGVWGLAAAGSGGKGYLFGGFSFDITNPSAIERRDAVVRFDPNAMEPVRTLTTRMPYAVQDAGAALVGNRIYVFGGLSNNDNSTNPCPMVRQYNDDTGEYEDRRLSVCTTDSIIQFDPGAEVAGSYAAKLPERAQFLSAAVTAGKAYLPGGRLSDGTSSASIIEFSPSADPPLRTLVPTLPRGLFGAPLTAGTDGSLFMFGGRWGGISELTDAIVKIVPGPTPAFPPRSLTTTQIAGGIRLSWEAPAYDGDSTIVSYRIYRSEPGGTATKIAEVNTLEHDDRTARPGAEYVYRVTAVNGVGESLAASTSRQAEATVPGGVRSLQATGVDEGAVVEWLPPADDGGSAITGYRVYRDGTLVRSLPPTPTTFRDADLTNGATYSYVVRAVNVKGEGAAVPARAATPAPVPEAPTGLQAEVQAAGVHLAWLAPASHIERFTVYRGTLPGALNVYANTTDTQFLDEQVQRGRTYYYAVTASNSEGESPQSRVSVSLVSKPGAPQNVFAAPLEGAIHLTWAPPSDLGEAREDALRYYISRKDPGASVFRILDTGGDIADTSYTDTKVLPGRPYVYTVTTLNPLASDPSAEATASAKEIANQKPVAFVTASSHEAEVGEQVTFDASKSTDPDGSIAYYLFDFNEGNSPVNSTAASVPHGFMKDGYYTVAVRAVDDDGAESDPVSITVKVGSPADDQEPVGATPPAGTGNGEDGDKKAPPGAIPGPGAALLVAAVAALALALRARRPPR